MAAGIILLVIFIILHRVGCIGGLTSLLGFGPSKVTAGPGSVVTSENSVTYTPLPTKSNPHPKAVTLPKAPDDKVRTVPNGAGGTDIRIERLALITEPTFGIIWNGSFGNELKDTFEPSFGIRLVKFSRIGLGPFLTPERAGAQLDYRVGNLTGAAGGAFTYGKPSLGLVLSVNVIPFN
jgi:hypothetical protein